MYNPQFNYSDRLVQNLVNLERNKVLIQNTDLNYNTRHKLNNHVRALNILHLSNIINLDLTLKDAEKLINNGNIEDVDEIRLSILKNFKNALDFNKSNMADTYSEFDRSLILHITKLVLTQWRETWESNFRSFNDKIDDRWDSFVGLRDVELPVPEIEREIAELVEWYKYASSVIAPGVRIAVVMYRLIEISPFTAGNKFIIAAVIDYLLIKNGLSLNVYSPTLRVIDQNNEKIIKAYNVAKSSNDLSFWIDSIIGLFSSELTEVREDLTEFVKQEEKSKEQPFLDLNKRQLKVLKYLQTVPTIKREDYCHMMEVSTMTAFRDLNDLVKKKLLKVEGRGRGTKYKLSSM